MDAILLPSKHRGMGFRFRGALSERTTVLECWHVVVVHGACEFTQLQCKRDRSSIGGRIAGQICGKVELVLRYASPDGGTAGTAQAGGYAVRYEKSPSRPRRDGQNLAENVRWKGFILSQKSPQKGVNSLKGPASSQRYPPNVRMALGHYVSV